MVCWYTIKEQDITGVGRMIPNTDTEKSSGLTGHATEVFSFTESNRGMAISYGLMAATMKETLRQMPSAVKENITG